MSSPAISQFDQWFLINLKEIGMQRINTSYFYRLALKLQPLRSLQAGPGKTVLDSYGDLYGASEELRFFLSNEVMPPVTCGGDGANLLEAIQKMMNHLFADPLPNATPGDSPNFADIQWNELQEILEALQRFEISLQSDFRVRDTFIVSPKAAYSTTLLAERGETLISEAARALVPSMHEDLHDAGRCLAFELPTAAAFHLFRAVEAMVCAYGEFVRQKKFFPAEKNNGLGGYANLLKEKKLNVDSRVITTIAQLAQLHRNPTMHPEQHLSNTEVLATFGIAVSVIETVALDWERRQKTPDIPLTDILPDDSKVLQLTSGNSSQPGATQP